MIEVQRSENINVKPYQLNSTIDEAEEPVEVTDLRVHFATFDAPSFDRRSDGTILPSASRGDAEDGRKASSGSEGDRILAPSADALAQWTEDENLMPCPICDRTFSAKALERHSNICQKVSATKRKVFDIAKTRTKDLEYVPPSSQIPVPRKKSSNNPEDDFQTCPHCSRKFGHKAYDRHVAWCEEKTRRLQTSPTKDMVALAKLHARNSYRPKTPSTTRKSSGGSSGSPTRKESLTPTPSLFFNRGDSRRSSMSRSNSRNEGVMSMSMSMAGDSSLKRSRSLRVSGSGGGGGTSGISSLNNSAHTVETEDTQFIRATTGRGSIKRGPAPTKASVLRAQAKAAEEARNGKKSVGGHDEYCQLNRMQRAPSVSSQYSGYGGGYGPSRGYASPAPSLRQRASSPSVRQRASSPSARAYSSVGFGSGVFDRMSSSGYGGFGGNNLPQALVKPSVVRPIEKVRGERREPEGIEHQSKLQPEATSGRMSAAISGSYDHSQEYDPYQSAARQMQELLFGTSFLNSSGSGGKASQADNNKTAEADAKVGGVSAGGGGGGSNSPPSLKPSTNSAFQKYVPANVPSTAEITSRLSGGGGGTTANSMLFGTAGSGRDNGSRSSRLAVPQLDSYMNTRRNSGWAENSKNAAGGGAATTTTTGGAKVARFCHECGNPFALPNIRFCCECGVKRLYC